MTQPSDRPYLRHRWSHRHPLHIAGVKLFNRAMSVVPLGPKYRIGQRARRDKAPYGLVKDGMSVVQVGAPRDVVDAGRSRGLHLALRAGNAGRCLIVEPDPDSADRVVEAAGELGLTSLSVARVGAWSSTTDLTFFIDDSHPAANFVREGTADYRDDELADFRRVTIAASSLDDLLDQHDMASVDLVSITTNGSEEAVLAGMERTLAKGHPTWLCLARTSDDFSPLLTRLGYELWSTDDRGFTFVRKPS